MTSLSQRDLAAHLNISDMTISRRMRALYRDRVSLTERDALMCLAVPEAMAAGFTSSVAIQLLNQYESEFRYCADDPARKCWIAFVVLNEKGNETTLSALKARHLETIIDSFPFSAVLPLHNIVNAAQAQLTKLKAIKARAAA